MSENLREAALDYHRYPTPGKISVTPTKAMATARDLSLAYSKGYPISSTYRASLCSGRVWYVLSRMSA